MGWRSSRGAFAVLIVLLASSAPLAFAKGLSIDEFEAMSDQLADASLELAQCLQDVAQLQQDLADLQATAVKVERRDGVAPSQV